MTGAFFPHILETHLTDHCNLNCSGCSHFAPLVKAPVFADQVIFARDFTRIKELFGGIREIRLMGGEPLLHPEIGFFAQFVRDLFPRADISIFTNGILLMQMPDKFWKGCSKNRIRIKLTRYPVGLDIGAIAARARAAHADIKIPPEIRKFFKHLNIRGDSDPAASFSNCRNMFKTPFLGNGRLYPCFFPAHAHIFSDYFGQAVSARDRDFIDIHSGIKPGEILEFLDRPIPMCRFCLTRRPFTPWGLSRREIGEWTGEEERRLPHGIRMLGYKAINRYHRAQKFFRGKT